MCFVSAKIFHVRNLLNALKCPLSGVYVIYFGRCSSDRCCSVVAEDPIVVLKAFNDNEGRPDERKSLELCFWRNFYKIVLADK